MRDLVERFLAKTKPDPDSECWLWVGAQTAKGYGNFFVHPRYGLPLPRYARAHRVAFVLFRGPLDPELVLDHTCRNRDCVNPYHLRACTHEENSTEANVYRWNGDDAAAEFWEDLEHGF